MTPTINANASSPRWAPIVNVLTDHHFDARAALPACTCGTRVHTREGFARHQLAQLLFVGAIPTETVIEWGVITPDREDPIPTSFAEAMRACNLPGTVHRIACRTAFPPGPWIEDLTPPPTYAPA